MNKLILSAAAVLALASSQAKADIIGTLQRRLALALLHLWAPQATLRVARWVPLALSAEWTVGHRASSRHLLVPSI